MVKILLVEDDKSLREIYGVRLLAEGYDIVSAGDGEEALAMAIKDRPDLIVSDVMMPKISGFDMLDILRSTTETKGIKVIMMTALSSEEQRQRGVALGADRYLVKSQVGIEDVVRTVHDVLGDAPVASASATSAFSSAPAAAAPSPIEPPVVAIPAPVAPVVPTPVTAAPAPTPAVVPTAPVVPTLAPIPTPVEAPSVTAAPAPVVPTPVTAAPAPTPAVVPVAPVTSAPVEPVLPQPSAPFSTPRNTGNTLADRVIQPLSPQNNAPDFGNMMSQELSQTPVTAPEVSGVDYEETPRTEASSTPSLPTPPEPPIIGL